MAQVPRTSFPTTAEDWKEWAEYYISRLRVSAQKLEETQDQNDSLLKALQAVGVLPDGYCFCANREQAEVGHTGECRDATDALLAAQGQEEEINWQERAENVKDLHEQEVRGRYVLEVHVQLLTQALGGLLEMLGWESGKAVREKASDWLWDSSHVEAEAIPAYLKARAALDLSGPEAGSPSVVR